jgi:acyl-coenzyme A thioesterase PaaI-like protein
MSELSPEHLLAMGRQVLHTQAFSRLLGAERTALAVPGVTSEFKINCVRPAVGERLLARADAVAVGKAQAVCRCDVFAVKGGEETLCAVAQGTIVRLGGG